MAVFRGGPEVAFRIIVEGEARFRLAFGKMPDVGVMFRFLAHFVKLEHILQDGFVLTNKDLADASDHGAMSARMIVIKLQHSFAVGGDACQCEGHAFADSGEVEYVSVGCHKREVPRFAEVPDSITAVVAVVEEREKFGFGFAVKLAERFLFLLFLHRAAVRCKYSIVLFKPFHGEGVIAKHAERIEGLAQFGCVSATRGSHVVNELIRNAPSGREDAAEGFARFGGHFER